MEEFDMPLEYGRSISFEEQLSISTSGTSTILEILRAAGVKATFYCTANYAAHQPESIRQIVQEGHEIASHGYYHSHFEPEHLKSSKLVLTDISNTPVTGFRMPGMMPVDELEVEKAGYVYNSSINPTWLPGRYNNFDKSRTWFYDGNVLQIPASVSPFVRVPLFWLSFHNFPLLFIKWMSSAAYKKDGYLNLYFHPWEFTDLRDKEKFGLPAYVARNSGALFVNRLKYFISWAQSKGYDFAKTGDFANSINKRQPVHRDR
ncbi:MAG TPA: polysaccharide deacetylase family protein [Mucilaginibacter sp.]|nr:polysaccharide deacetylase family protein [Mucilaginibacter sp.]